MARYLVVAWLLPAVALADPPADGAAHRAPAGDVAAALVDATALLSRYPPGTVPLEVPVVAAFHVLAEHGDRHEVSLLRSLATTERPEVRLLASESISAIRERQIRRQRAEFAEGLPAWPEIRAAAGTYRQQGLGREEAACAAYVDRVLGRKVVRSPHPGDGDAAELLATGQPARALAATAEASTPESRMLAARAREELGDVFGAVHVYATLLAEGHEPAREPLKRYGIDTERLLLGLLAHPGRPVDHDEQRTLEQLVRHGEDLTVRVLAERTRRASPSDAAAATDAIARMRIRAIAMEGPSDEP